ncbi:hypothetical protein [Enterobacter sp. RIT418]|uniref:hypothetical protein n=1 Tax=Enterobacter sp. RIT418 TaxID=2202164 RepID=UPI000D4772CD|nr:hypothetical protein [Enterobacter sp. RIT 418]RAU32724.1 hypothetical protein DBY73_017050 [Enterobacter sp. RIT 418]
MSTICLAAQRSYETGEAVWFSYRFPSLKKVFGNTFLWMLGIAAVIIAGLYAHVYWNLRHPAPEPVKVNTTKPETSLSDMHYVYVSKPFPHPQPKPIPVHEDVPPMQDMPINGDDADWQQAPDGNLDAPHDTSRDTLPGTEEHDSPASGADDDSASLKTLFMQALKEQEQDYSQGKIPAPPTDETQGNVEVKEEQQKITRPPFIEKRTGGSH